MDVLRTVTIVVLLGMMAYFSYQAIELYGDMRRSTRRERERTRDRERSLDERLKALDAQERRAVGELVESVVERTLGDSLRRLNFQSTFTNVAVAAIGVVVTFII
jgi:hypothetical protein